MERLKDETSTNLYIEGLPLNIDEPVCIFYCTTYHFLTISLFIYLDYGCFSCPLCDQEQPILPDKAESSP
jgi:hypothetical protein